jgi:hypothetical protein
MDSALLDDSHLAAVQPCEASGVADVVVSHLPAASLLEPIIAHLHGSCPDLALTTVTSKLNGHNCRSESELMAAHDIDPADSSIEADEFLPQVLSCAPLQLLDALPRELCSDELHAVIEDCSRSGVQTAQRMQRERLPEPLANESSRWASHAKGPRLSTRHLAEPLDCCGDSDAAMGSESEAGFLPPIALRSLARSQAPTRELVTSPCELLADIKDSRGAVSSSWWQYPIQALFDFTAVAACDCTHGAESAQGDHKQADIVDETAEDMYGEAIASLIERHAEVMHTPVIVVL